MSLDTHQIQRALEEYYRNKLPGRENVKILDITYIGDGLSHYMYSFHLEYVERPAKHCQSLILRMGRYKEELRKEFQALEKLYSTSIPAPRVRDVGEDMLGLGFIIMDKVEGENMGKALDGMSEAEQSELWKQFSGLLADIHRLDWKSAGFDFLDPPEGKYGYINRWLSGLREWCRYMELHTLNPILDWLEEKKVPSDHYVLLHGDYLPDNVIVCQGEIAAIVDWDAVSIGDAAYDVCWPPLVFRLLDLSGERSDSFLRHYKEAIGKEVQNLDFYQILRAAFLLFITLSIKKRGVRELGAKEEAEMLIHSQLDLGGRCAEFIEERTGITFSGVKG